MARKTNFLKFKLTLWRFSLSHFNFVSFLSHSISLLNRVNDKYGLHRNQSILLKRLSLSQKLIQLLLTPSMTQQEEVMSIKLLKCWMLERQLIFVISVVIQHSKLQQGSNTVTLFSCCHNMEGTLIDKMRLAGHRFMVLHLITMLRSLKFCWIRVLQRTSREMMVTPLSTLHVGGIT